VVSDVPFSFLNRDFCISIQTRHRTYYASGEDLEDCKMWISCLKIDSKNQFSSGVSFLPSSPSFLLDRQQQTTTTTNNKKRQTTTTMKNVSNMERNQSMRHEQRSKRSRSQKATGLQETGSTLRYLNTANKPFHTIRSRPIS